MLRIYFGNIEGDAGYWYIGSDHKIHHVPGWDPEGMLQFSSAIRIIREAALLRQQVGM
jgi:hypothetical protein